MKKILMIAGMMVLAASPVFGVSPVDAADSDDKGGATQELTVDGQTVTRTVSEIRLDGNNAILQFTDGGTMEVDMQTVSISLSYNDATDIPTLRLEGADGTRVYDLQGRRVSERQLENKSLPDGVYIVDGKKVSYKKK